MDKRKLESDKEIVTSLRWLADLKPHPIYKVNKHMHLITHAPLLTDALCLRFVCVVCARCVYGCVCCVAFAWATCISPELPLSLLNCLFTIVDGKVTWLSRWCFQPSDWYAQHNSALFTRIQSYIHTLHALTQTRTQLS